MFCMTPEEKAMTEKSLPVKSDDKSIPLREDTYKLVDADQEKPKDKEEPPVAEKEATPEPPKEKLSLTDLKNQNEGKVDGATVETADKLTNEAMVKMIDDKLKKMSDDDYISIKINRIGLVIGIGIALILLWLLPVVNFGLQKVSGGSYSLDSLKSTNVFNLIPVEEPIQEEVAPTPEPTPSLTVRVRMGENSLSEGEALKQKLEAAGFTQVQIVFDDQVNADIVTIATKIDQKELFDVLSATLAEDYNVSTEAAELTDDSDFDAAVLVGADSKQ